MSGTLNRTLDEASEGVLADAGLGRMGSRLNILSEAPKHPPCFHCGEPCADEAFSEGAKVFCCQGCLAVHDVLIKSGLRRFYALSSKPGARICGPGGEQWSYLDEPAVRERLVDYTDTRTTRVTFQIPAIHCVACVWLLENLFRLHPAIGASQVNFLRRELSVSFATEKMRLSELVELLVSIGYRPQLTLGELDGPARKPSHRRDWLQAGVAGFAFGNIMLLSLPVYLGLDSFSEPLFKKLFGCLSLAFAAPVIAYSASDYWRSAWLSVRQRMLTLDVPIALGLAALYFQSAWDILSGHGAGFLDSLTGLVFFLLCGRMFQQKTHERIVFDRDYKCFFPLAASRKKGCGEESVAISSLAVGDRLFLRNGELIPADARLIEGPARIDYSFVTGESEAVEPGAGDYLYAGGKQVGGRIEIELAKAVSQSYLVSLWNHEAFRKTRQESLDTLTNRYSGWFTLLVIGVAVGAALFWARSGDLARAGKAFASVLIVACPCALALAAPFGLGSAQRWLARRGIFLRNPLVLERLVNVNAIVFDKTGTLTTPQGAEASFWNAGAQAAKERLLSLAEAGWVWAVARQSAHPHAARIAESLKAPMPPRLQGHGFIENCGAGIVGVAEGHEIRLGSRPWLAKGGVSTPDELEPLGSVSYLAIDGQFRGAFVFGNGLRPAVGRLAHELGPRYNLALLSGDNERERDSFRSLLGPAAGLHFNQTPLDKLAFIRQMQKSGKTVMMVGDGLNDAGALSQSDVGVAVVEKIGAFSPASDVIMPGAKVGELGGVLELARVAVRIVRVSLGISAGYNLAGISIAAAGILSPVFCAILMPLSSISVVLFACGATHWAAERAGIKP